MMTNALMWLTLPLVLVFRNKNGIQIQMVSKAKYTDTNYYKYNI